MLEAYVFCCVVYKLIKYECLITKACQGYTDNPSTHEKNCLHLNIEKFHGWSVPYSGLRFQSIWDTKNPNKLLKAILLLSSLMIFKFNWWTCTCDLGIRIIPKGYF
jgi:hypothetical protein